MFADLGFYNSNLGFWVLDSEFSILHETKLPQKEKLQFNIYYNGQNLYTFL
jgi:hypothetical protein